MPKQVMLALIIEAGLIAMTVILLAQPKPLFPSKSQNMRTLVNFGGMIFMCLTFCWSVIFGCILALHDLTFRI